MKVCLVLLLALLPQIGLAKRAIPSEVAQSFNLVGSATMSVAFLKVYDAQLFSKGERLSYFDDFALNLTYHLGLKGSAIAERSIKEIKKLGFKDELKLNHWHRWLEDSLPDVEKGDSLLGLRLASGKVIFYFNGQYLSDIDDPQFAQYFFDIWLSENTSRPKLRGRLIGG